MGLGRFVARAVGGIVALAVTAFVVFPVLAVITVVGVPLIIMAVVGIIAAIAMFSVGLPVLIVGILVAIALAALISVTVGLASFGLLLIKIAFVAIVLSWLFRKLFRRTPRPSPVLVGAPVVDVAAPRRDKYDIAAERELDEELGL
jgi:hypothetical protein